MSAKKKPARKSTKKTAADGMVAEVLEGNIRAIAKIGSGAECLFTSRQDDDASTLLDFPQTIAQFDRHIHGEGVSRRWVVEAQPCDVAQTLDQNPAVGHFFPSQWKGLRHVTRPIRSCDGQLISPLRG